MDYKEIEELVNSQIVHHDHEAEQASSCNDDRGVEQHKALAERWRQALCSIQQLSNQASPLASDDATTLRPEDLEGLPDDLLAELNRDNLEIQIQAIIKGVGGVMSLDRLMIALYRETGEIHKRRQLTQKLYRMVSKGALHSVPHRKSVYSIFPQPESNRKDRAGKTHDQNDEEVSDDEDYRIKKEP